MKFLSQLNPSKSELRHMDGQTPVTFLPMEAIGENGGVDRSRDRALSEVMTGYTYLAEGDVCLAKITPCFENGKAAVVRGLRNGVAFATTEVIPLRCRAEANARFLYFLLTSSPFKHEAEAAMHGAGGQKRVPDRFVGDYRAFVPPLEEQTQIANFLDYETAKIDALIEKQQQLIKLLKEKRQAVISHAVTKGLNPDAPMRDSGVEWLGEVPAHWEVITMNRFSTKITNGYVGPTRGLFVEQGVKYLQSLHIKHDRIVFHPPYYVTSGWSESKRKSILRLGDVLIVQTGDIGQCAAVPAEFEGANCHALIIVSTKPNRMVGAFLSSCLNGTYGRHSLKSIQTGALHPHLNCGSVKFLRIPAPPVQEQLEIVRRVERERHRYDKLESASEDLIDLLQERRAALISAAVTGKIDVRDWTPPESDSEPAVA